MATGPYDRRATYGDDDDNNCSRQRDPHCLEIDTRSAVADLSEAHLESKDGKDSGE